MIKFNNLYKQLISESQYDKNVKISEYAPGVWKRDYIRVDDKAHINAYFSSREGAEADSIPLHPK